MIYFVKRHHVNLLLLSICLLGFVLRILAWRIEPTVSRDGLFYITLIEGLHEGGFQNIDYYNIPGLYLYCSHLLMYTGLSAEIAGVLLNIFLGTFLIVVFERIGFLLTKDRRIGVACALLTAVHPELINYSHEAQREIFFLFFSGIAIIFFLYGMQYKKMLIFCISGAVTYLAFLSRIEALILYGGVCVAFCVFIAIKMVCWRDGVRFGVSFIMGTLLLSGIFSIFTSLNQWQFYYISNRLNFYFS